MTFEKTAKRLKDNSDRLCFSTDVCYSLSYAQILADLSVNMNRNEKEVNGFFFEGLNSK